MGTNLAFVGKYRVDGVVGAGAQGQIIKAFDESLDRMVAIKSLKTQSNGANKNSLVDEAKALARLSHPNIVSVFEIIEQDDENYIVMEYVDGVNLAKALEDESLSVEQSQDIILQIADALAYAHDAKIIHGDLKPANIMLGKDGKPRLIDFGLADAKNQDDILATIIDSDAAAASFEGTLPYMAPEKIMGQISDERADIFAIGAVFHEMLTGQRAFSGNGQGELLNQVLNVTPPLPSSLAADIPSWLDQLIEAMLEKDQDKRIGSMAEVRVRINLQGQRDWRSRLYETAHRVGRMLFKKRTTSMWIKAAGAALIIFLVAWTGRIVVEDIITPVSVRMEQGLDLVRNFHQDGAIEEAKEKFGSIIAEDPDHVGADAGLALALMREYTSKEFDSATLRRATALAEESVAAAPQLGVANIAAAWAAEFNGDFESADRLYDMASLLDPDNALIFEGRVRLLKKQGNFEAAEGLLKLAIETHPSERIFYDGYGEILIRQGDFAGAERIQRKGLLVAPDNVQGYANLAQSLHMQGKTKEAIRVVQNGLEVGENVNLYNNLGTYLFFQGQYEQSALAFERTLEFEGDTHNFIAWANLADAQRYVPGKADDAKNSYRRAIQLLESLIKARPEDEGLNSRLAVYAAKADDFQTAREGLAIALRRAVKEPATYYRAMVAYEIMGNRKLALDMMEQALDADYPLGEIENGPELAELRQDTQYHIIISKRGSEK